MPDTSDLRYESGHTARRGASAPLFDWQDIASPEGVRGVRDACREPGWFALRADDETARHIAGTLGAMRQFYTLADDHDIKKDVCVNPQLGKYGWTPMYGEPAYQPGTIAHLESFDCGFGAANRWPAIADFQKNIEACRGQLATLGDRVLESLAIAAGLRLSFFQERCNSRELSTMRLLHYPPNDAVESSTNVGIAAHTDFECITLIIQTAPGLELRSVDGEWREASGDESTIVVLLGDMLERWTNGEFAATGHRVRNTRHPRFSIVLFCAVNAGEIVAPLAEFVHADRPAQYGATEQAAYLQEQVRRAEKLRDDKD